MFDAMDDGSQAAPKVDRRAAWVKRLDELSQDDLIKVLALIDHGIMSVEEVRRDVFGLAPSEIERVDVRSMED